MRFHSAGCRLILLNDISGGAASGSKGSHVILCVKKQIMLCALIIIAVTLYINEGEMAVTSVNIIPIQLHDKGQCVVIVINVQFL